MGRYCSIGKIDKNYIYIAIISSITLGIGFISMYFFKDNKGILKGAEPNKLLKTLSRYLGFSLCYFGELILQRYMKRKEEIKEDELIYKDKKRAKIMDCIFSDFRNKLKSKDILFFLFICLINLIDDFMIIYIKAKKDQGFIIFTEEYNSIEFILLFIISIFIFKMIYYKHQHISIILVILMELFRNVIRQYNDKNFSFDYFIFQAIRALCDCICFGYIKALMEYKFFSEYKCCYIFGFVNTPILIVLYIIFSHISFKEKNLLCSLEYNGSYYFDNFYSIFKNINFIQVFTFLVYTICNGVYQLLVNKTIGQFTMCHLFIPCQITQLTINIYDSRSDWKLLSTVIISGFFEILFTLVFLELIVLNFLGLNKNVKKNIINRAVEDVEISQIEERRNSNILLNENYSYNPDWEDENNVPSQKKNEGNNIENE